MWSKRARVSILLIPLALLMSSLFIRSVIAQPHPVGDRSMPKDFVRPAPPGQAADGSQLPAIPPPFPTGEAARYQANAPECPEGVYRLPSPYPNIPGCRLNAVHLAGSAYPRSIASPPTDPAPAATSRPGSTLSWERSLASGG
jgi:hypothetical protein